jgi:hypothetical protein
MLSVSIPDVNPVKSSYDHQAILGFPASPAQHPAEKYGKNNK